MTENVNIDFTVYVDISTSPATYTYTNAQGVSCDGCATVTNNNTNIIYTLGTPGLIFVDPSSQVTMGVTYNGILLTKDCV